MTGEDPIIERQQQSAAQKQKQAELESKRKNISEQRDSIKKTRVSTVQSTVPSISPDVSRVGIAKDELKRLSGQLKLNESNLASLQVERAGTTESIRQVQLDQQIFDLQEKINEICEKIQHY